MTKYNSFWVGLISSKGAGDWHKTGHIFKPATHNFYEGEQRLVRSD